jgi:hypothetical protein
MTQTTARLDHIRRTMSGRSVPNWRGAGFADRSAIRFMNAKKNAFSVGMAESHGGRFRRRVTTRSRNWPSIHRC